MMLERYAGLEARVQVIMSAQCAPHCRVCKKPCCRAHFCRENRDSPFLAAVTARSGDGASFDRYQGWMSGCGCRLKIGRPPVCYDFVCDKIFKDQPSALHRYVLDVLSKLMDHCGRRVWRGRHIVEAVSREDLAAVHAVKFMERMEEAERALEAIAHFYAEGQIAVQGLPALQKIIPVPAEVIEASALSAPRYG